MSAAQDKIKLKSILVKFGFKKDATGVFYEHKKNQWYAEILNFGNFCEVWMSGNGLKSSGFPGGYNYSDETLLKELERVTKKSS